VSSRRGLFGLVLGLAGVGGCASEPTTVPCGTEVAPGELRITKRIPELGASVKNLDIEESFTVGDSPISFEMRGILIEAATHTAGYDVSGRDFSRQPTLGKDVTFQRVVDAWSKAPGHVEIAAIAGWKTEDGCHYRLPDPVLSYDVTP